MNKYKHIMTHYKGSPVIGVNNDIADKYLAWLTPEMRSGKRHEILKFVFGISCFILKQKYL